MIKEKKYRLRGISLEKLNLLTSNSNNDLRKIKTIDNSMKIIKQKLLFSESTKKFKSNFSSTRVSFRKKTEFLPSYKTVESNLSSSNCKTIDTTKRKKKKKLIINHLKTPFNKENFFKYFKLQKIRKKYHLILDNHPKNVIEFKGLPGVIKNKNNELMKNLKKENETIFNSPFSLIHKERFSKKYQNILEKFDFIERTFKSKSPEQTSFKTLKLFEENIKKTKLINEKISKINDQQYHKLILKKFKETILKIYYLFKRSDIKLKDFFQDPYLKKTLTEQKTIFNTLIRSIKIKNLNLSILLLEEYKHLVFSYDLYKQTPLHWVSKRNFYYIIPKILSYGANINSIDFSGFTPLHLSIINNNFDTFVILILFGAFPFVYDNFKKKPIDYCSDYKYQCLIKKSSLLYVQYLFGKVKSFFEDLQFELSRYIENEFRFALEKPAFNIVKKVRNRETIVVDEIIV